MRQDKQNYWMDMAFSEAEKAVVRTLPNPRVGAVLVKEGRLIARGYHPGPGRPHAEDEVLHKAGKDAAGADLFCTLEPCCAFYPGKNRQPCTEKIIKAGIKRVFISAPDPDSHVNGEGIRKLREAGCSVFTGILQSRSEALNREYFFAQRHGRPFVTIKAALTLDGRIAAENGSSKWITDEKARALVHRQRSECDAILVGSETINRDNPSLTVRPANGPQPLRVVLSRLLRMQKDRRIFSSDLLPGTVVYTCVNPADEGWNYPAGLGPEMVTLPGGDNFLQQVMAELAGRKIRSLLVEGGSRVISSFLKAGLFEKISFYYAPKILGSGYPVCEGLDAVNLGQAILLENAEAGSIGSGQVRIEGYRSEYWKSVGGMPCSQE